MLAIPPTRTCFSALGSGLSNQAGSRDNTFVGTYAGLYNRLGVGNSFLGNAAGSQSSGSYNILIGYEADGLGAAGSQNTIVGAYAGYLTDGDKNTFIGDGAGNNNTTGHDNTFIGNFAGSSNSTGSNDIYVAVSPPYSDESNSIRIGDVQTAAYMAGIYGTTSSSGLAVYVNSSGQLGTLTSSRR